MTMIAVRTAYADRHAALIVGLMLVAASVVRPARAACGPVAGPLACC